MKFQAVGQVVPSPDAKWVVYAQSRSVVEAEKSEVLTHIFLASADGSRRLQLTRGEKSSSDPAFSPDGRFIYFLSERAGKKNVFRIAVRGGEAEQITEFKGAVEVFRVSPDGKQVAFAGYEPPPDLEKAKKEKRDMRVVGADTQNHTLYVAAVEADADGKHAQKKLLTAVYHVASFNWSPDSKAIAFAHQPTSIADDWTKSDVSEVEVEGTRVHDIAASAAAEVSPVYSPDGRYIAFTRTSIPVKWAADHRIVIISRQGGAGRDLPATEDEQPTIVGWSGDSKSIFFQEAKRTKNVIFAMPVDGPPRILFEPKTGTIGGSVSANLTGTALGLVEEAPDRAPEAFVLAVGSASPVQVSRANTDIPMPVMGKTEVIRWKSKDGLEVEGLLTLPSNYEKGKKYPLILNIHGGPTGVFGESFVGRAALYPIAAFSERGYAVLRPNPRGSSGYGKKFRFANYNDWGGRDYEDDQTGVDKVIEMGVADPERLAVMGWSYGGFMTSWTITQTHRFKAAAIGAGVTNLWSFTGTADIAGFLPDYFGGEPWETFESWTKHSPITHIKNVQTPTLILHGEADDRVPVSQGYEYYNALKREGVVAKMVVYPRQQHGPREPKFVMDIMQRHLDWMERYVR